MNNLKTTAATQYKIIKLIGEGSFGKAYLVEASDGKCRYELLEVDSLRSFLK